MIDKISRDAPCPCGSGEKYKHCCLPVDRAAALSESMLPALAKVAAEHAWQVGVVPLPILFDDQPGRRVTAVLVTAGGNVIHHDLLTDPLGRIDEVVEVVESAIEAAGKRMGVRPLRIEVRHEAIARALGTRLAVQGIAYT
jgi:SEC-C motif-containing protein